MNDQLTFKQQKFCDEYLISYNAYRAAVIAGYSHNSARKAELLHIPKVQMYLRAAMAKGAERAQISHQRILREYEKIAFSNMGDYFDYKGTGKQIIEMTAEEKAALSYYEVVNVVDKNDVLIGEKVKIKLHNKMAALDKIARHTDFFNAKARQPITMQPDADTTDTAEDAAFEQQHGQADGGAYQLSREVAAELHNCWGHVQGDFDMEAEPPKNTEQEVFNLAWQDGDNVPKDNDSSQGDVNNTLIKEVRGTETIENLLTISPLKYGPEAGGVNSPPALISGNANCLVSSTS